MIQHIFILSMFLGFSIGFAAMWNKDRSCRYTGLWSVSYGCAFLGYGLKALPVVISASIYVSLAADAFYLAGPTFLVLGLAAKFEKKEPVALLWAIYTVAAALYLIARFYIQDTHLGADLLSFGCAALTGVGAIILLQAMQTKLNRMLFLVLCALVGLFLAPSLFQLNLEPHSAVPGTNDETFALQLMQFATAALVVMLAVLLYAHVALRRIDDLRFQSDTDFLTKLKNRGAFETIAQKVVAKSQVEQKPFSLILCDIDHFKSVNDQYGHGAGDRVLTRFGEILDARSREADIVGRVGGEEFAILVFNGDLELAQILANRMCSEIRNTIIKADEFDISVTASFGVAQLRAGETYSDLLKTADKALYQAKDAGRDQVNAAIDQNAQLFALSA